MSGKYIIANLDGRSNYHTHTYYCDGKNSVDEMVEKAISIGFRSIGFSGHQFSEQDADYAMSPAAEEKYKEDICSAKGKYADDIEIYLGIERDSCCEATSGFQYVIGSTHHVQMDDVWLNVDESPEVFQKAAGEYFDGDYMAFSECYYDFEAKVLERTKGQIVGHFDLITVFNQGNRFFNEEDAAYKRWAINSAERIVESFLSSDSSKLIPQDFPEELGEVIYKTGMPIFEINTGAMAKGRRLVPYPATFIIDYLASMGVPMVLNSDCHDRDYLNYGFRELIERYK